MRRAGSSVSLAAPWPWSQRDRGLIAPEIVGITVRSALTRPTGGFLCQGERPFTHSLSPYVGCGFGRTACGTYCYAPYLPAWRTRAGGSHWGERVLVKGNLPEVSGKSFAEGTGRGAAVGFSAEGFASVPGRRVSAAFPEG